MLFRLSTSFSDQSIDQAAFILISTHQVYHNSNQRSLNTSLDKIKGCISNKTPGLSGMFPVSIASRMATVSAVSTIKTGAPVKGVDAVTTIIGARSMMTTLATTRSRIRRWRTSWEKTAQQESQLPEPPPPLLLPPPSRRRQRPPPSPFPLLMPMQPPSSALLWEDPRPIPRKDARQLTRVYVLTFLLLLFAASLSDYRRRKQQHLTSPAPSLQALKLNNDEQ